MRYFLLLLSFLCLPVHAGKIITANVEYEDERYFVEIEMLIKAPTDKVYTLFTDYDHLNRINKTVTKSNLVYSIDDNTHRVNVLSEACVSFFCIKVKQLQDVEEQKDGIIFVTDVPGKSDTVYAHSRWHIRQENEFTRVTYNTDLKPDFWVPPLIGPYLIKRKLREASLETINAVEKLANKLADDV